MAKKKKIRLLMHAFFDESNIQAQSRDSLHWTLFLDENKYEITAFYVDKVSTKLADKKNVRLIKVPRNKYLKNARILFSLFNPFYTHILVANASPLVMLFLFLKKTLRNGKNVYISLVNRLPYEKFTDLIYHKEFNQFGISQKICDDFERITGRKIPLIHLLYDLEKFKPLDFEKKENLVVCVGSHQIRKNPFLFANLAKELPNHDFVWIGDGYYRSWIEDKIEKEKINNLRLIRKLNQSDLSQFLSKAKLFVFPSIHEGFPNVIVESMACGLPIIAMSSYGPEAVKNGFNGYVVDNEFQMLEKVKFLMSNLNELQEMSKNSRKRAYLYTGKDGIREFEQVIK